MRSMRRMQSAERLATSCTSRIVVSLLLTFSMTSMPLSMLSFTPTIVS